VLDLLGGDDVFNAASGWASWLIMAQKTTKGGAASRGLGRYVAFAGVHEPRESRGFDDAGGGAAAITAAEFKVQRDGCEKADSGAVTILDLAGGLIAIDCEIYGFHPRIHGFGGKFVNLLVRPECEFAETAEAVRQAVEQVARRDAIAGRRNWVAAAVGLVVGGCCFSELSGGGHCNESVWLQHDSYSSFSCFVSFVPADCVSDDAKL